MSPLQPSAVYTAEDPDHLDAIYEGREPGFTYAREGHPNAVVLARMIDDLEGAEGGTVTGSGMAALSALFLGALQEGDHVVGGDQLYGRTLRMLREDLPRMGFETSLADASDVSAVEAAIRADTRMILVETVTNPTVRIADIDGIARLARDRGILLAVDNTFATPLGFSPLDHGADVVIHSVTKLLAGHSDATLGYVVARDPDLNASIADAARTWGLTSSAFDCWLAERGLLSFPLRYRQASGNAARLADALADMPGVVRVLYPTRADHPDRALAGTLTNGGNMVSFQIGGDRAAAVRFTRAVAPVAFAPTLGDINTTLSHPRSSSHRSVSADQLAAVGITEGFFRVSVGVEDIETLVAAFDRGVRAAVG